METGLAGKTVVVTGATANIGRAIALAFAAEGSVVVAVGRDEDQGALVCELAKTQGAAGVMWSRTDVTRRGDVETMVGEVQERFGPVDVLVNNVGGNVDGDLFVDSDPATWEKDIALNFTTVLNCTHAALPGMIGAGAGRIINIGSTSGLLGDRGLAVYSAMKGAVHAFTKVLAKEVGVHGITVNAIAPYGTLPGPDEISSGSRFHRHGVIAGLLSTKGDLMAAMSRKTVMQRQFAKPAEVGATAVFLASEAAAFVTAQVVAVDGGTLVA